MTGFVDNLSYQEFQPMVEVTLESNNGQKTMFYYEEMDPHKWHLYEHFPEQYGVIKPPYVNEMQWRQILDPNNYRSDTAQAAYLERKEKERKKAEYEKHYSAINNIKIPDELTTTFDRMNYFIGSFNKNLEEEENQNRVPFTQLDVEYWRETNGEEPKDLWLARNYYKYGHLMSTQQYQQLQYQSYYQPQQNFYQQPSYQEPITEEFKQAIEKEVEERVHAPVFEPKNQEEQDILNGFKQRLDQSRRNRGQITSQFMAKSYDANTTDNFAPPLALANDIVQHTSDQVTFPQVGYVPYNNQTYTPPSYTNYANYGNSNYTESDPTRKDYNIYGEYNPNGIKMYYPRGMSNYTRYKPRDRYVGSGLWVDADNRVTRVDRVPEEDPNEPIYFSPDILTEQEFKDLIRGIKPQRILDNRARENGTLVEKEDETEAAYLNGHNVTGMGELETLARRLKKENPFKNNSFYGVDGLECEGMVSSYSKIYDKDIEMVAGNYTEFLASNRKQKQMTQFAVARENKPMDYYNGDYNTGVAVEQQVSTNAPRKRRVVNYSDLTIDPITGKPVLLDKPKNDEPEFILSPTGDWMPNKRYRKPDNISNENIITPTPSACDETIQETTPPSSNVNVEVSNDGMISLSPELYVKPKIQPSVFIENTESKTTEESVDSGLNITSVTFRKRTLDKVNERKSYPLNDYYDNLNTENQQYENSNTVSNIIEENGDAYVDDSYEPTQNFTKVKKKDKKLNDDELRFKKGLHQKNKKNNNTKG